MGRAFRFSDERPCELDFEKWGPVGTIVGTSSPSPDNDEVANVKDASDFTK